MKTVDVLHILDRAHLSELKNSDPRFSYNDMLYQDTHFNYNIFIEPVLPDCYDIDNKNFEIWKYNSYSHIPVMNNYILNKSYAYECRGSNLMDNNYPLIPLVCNSYKNASMFINLTVHETIDSETLELCLDNLCLIIDSNKPDITNVNFQINTIDTELLNASWFYDYSTYIQNIDLFFLGESILYDDREELERFFTNYHDNYYNYNQFMYYNDYYESELLYVKHGTTLHETRHQCDEFFLELNMLGPQGPIGQTGPTDYSYNIPIENIIESETIYDFINIGAVTNIVGFENGVICRCFNTVSDNTEYPRFVMQNVITKDIFPLNNLYAYIDLCKLIPDFIHYIRTKEQAVLSGNDNTYMTVDLKIFLNYNV